MNLLFEDKNNTGKVLIGSGIEVLFRGKEVDVYKNYQFIETKQMNTSFEKRLTVVQLISNYKAMKSRISVHFGVSRQSIDNWLKSYEKDGVMGLINNTKDSWKKNPHRFVGNKSKQHEQDNQARKAIEQEKEAELKAEQEPEIDFDTPGVTITPVKTESYTECYGFEDNRYAGSMILIAMIEHLYNFHNLSAGFFDGQISFLYIFLQMHILQIDSVEQLKVKNKHELGRVTGQRKLPSLPIIWRDIHQGVNSSKGEIFKEYIFNYQAIRGLVSLEELALDGHFIPYYGKIIIHKGYFTQRDLMIKGQTQMFLHDSSGRIVYFDTQEGKGDIVSTLKHVSNY